MPTLYTSKLQTIADALATRIGEAPVLVAEECQVISRVDDAISSLIEERVAKAGGLLVVIALQSIAPIEAGAPGPRLRVTWNLSLWARRSKRTQLNTGPVLYEALLAQVQNWMPDEDGLTYDEFQLVRGGQQPDPKYSLYEASFASCVTLAQPVVIP